MEKDVAQTWWSVVAASPPATIVAVAVLVGVIWSIVNWAFRQRIEALQERLNLANDRLLKSNEDLERLRDQLTAPRLSPATVRAATPILSPAPALISPVPPAAVPAAPPAGAPALRPVAAPSISVDLGPLLDQVGDYASEIARIIDANTATISVSGASRAAKPRAKKD